MPLGFGVKIWVNIFFLIFKKIKSIENVLNPLGLTVLQDPRALSLTAMLN